MIYQALVTLRARLWRIGRGGTISASCTDRARGLAMGANIVGVRIRLWLLTPKFVPGTQPITLMIFEVLQVSYVVYLLFTFGWSALIGGIIALAMTYLIALRIVRAWRVVNWILIVLLVVGIPMYLFVVQDHSSRQTWLEFAYLAASLVLLMLPESREWFLNDQDEGVSGLVEGLPTTDSSTASDD